MKAITGEQSGRRRWWVGIEEIWKKEREEGEGKDEVHACLFKTY